MLVFLANILIFLLTVGDMIAMGSQNGSIYLFRVSRDGFSYKKVNKIRGSQPLTHLDWSMDGNFVQTVTIDFDLLFWDAKSLSPERSPIAMKDVKWLTSNCTVGFLVAGQWSNRYYGNSNTIIATCSRSATQDMLVSGDADGYIRLFRCGFFVINVRIWIYIFIKLQISLHKSSR